MKQAQLKSIFVMILIFAIIGGIAYAFERISLNYPSGEWVLSNSVPFNFTVNTTSASITYCALYANNTGTMAFKANYTNIVNATNHIAGVTINDSHAFNVVGWNVTCNNGTTDFSATVANFSVDGSVPSIVQDSPASGVYLDNLNTTLFKYTPTDTSNPLDCDFYTNLSGTWQANQTNRTWASGTQISVNLSNNTKSTQHTAATIPDGKYVWGVSCNDTAGNGNDIFTQNRTFIVDTIVPTTPSFSIPENMNQTNATLYVEWSVITEVNFDRYDAVLSPYANMSDPTQLISVSGNTSKNFTTFSSVVDGNYSIQIRAYDLVGHSANSTVRMYVLDTVVPNVTLNFPTANNSFLSDSTPDFNVTVLDMNPDSCILLLSAVSGASLLSNGTRLLVPNGTKINLTPTTMANGVYLFNVECNDTVNHRVNASAGVLQTTIDTIVPTESNITSTFHQTNDTNKFPILRWNLTFESNFSKYQARAFYIGNNSLAYEVNVTNQSIGSAQLNLSSNSSYNFSVIAHDLAGNTAASSNTTIQTIYFTDPICAVLNTGWNICGAVWTSPKTLSLIANETGANQVAVFNSSHKFATCNAAVSTTGQHCQVTTNISNPMSGNGSKIGVYDTNVNHVVFIYVNTTTDYRNRTWAANAFSSNITLTNASGIGWNIEAGFKRGVITFGQLAYEQFFTNVSLFSIPYNNGSSRPYVNNGLFRGLNNNTNLEYGRGIWLFYNTSAPIINSTLANTTYTVGSW